MKRIMFATAALIATGCSTTPPPTASKQEPVQYYEPEQQTGYVGARGPDGPAGARGPQGSTGQAGAPGYASAGSRGEAGATGAVGEPGRAGPRGPAGDMAVGPTGAVGPAGDAGPQGAVGQTGARGASAEGYAGPAGPAGRAGAQGPAGDAGPKGPTTLGPAGPAGRPGPAGERGESGAVGAQGSTTAGVAGPSGAAGATGAQGPSGPTGPQGPAGGIDRWTSYRDFWFDTDMALIHDADSAKIAEIASYMNDNPSLYLGIDGSTNPRATDRRAMDLGDRRVRAVRDALIQAGVPANRVSSGMFGNADLRRDGRVEVLLKSDQLPQATLSVNGSTTDLERWTTYRDFWFDTDRAVVHDADSGKVAEIASYMKRNPSLQLGIDSTNTNGADLRSLDLAGRRGNAVRDALIAAGVPASSIKSGAFGDANSRRDGRVEVLVRTNRLAQQ